MADPPGGSVTFLFTGIEGSTKLLHELRERLLPEALDGLTLRDLGEYRLKDLSPLQSLHQLVGEGL